MSRKQRRAQAKQREQGEAATGDPAALQALFQQAQQKYESGHYKDAENILRRALRGDAGNSDGHLLMGLALQQQGKARRARQAIGQALDCDPRNAFAYLCLGNLMKEIGERDAAADAFARALNLKPDFAEAYRGLGLLMGDAGILDQAIDCFNLALQYDPQHADSFFHLGLLQTAQGLASEALASYARAVAIDPAHAPAQVNLGNIALAHGKAELAVETYEKAIVAHPDMAEAHANLGKALKDLGRFEEGVEACRTALRLQPKFADAHNNLGNVLKELGRLEDAKASYVNAISIDDRQAPYHYNHGDALHQNQEYDAAVVSYSKAIALDPTMAVAHNNIGLVLNEQGHLEDALAHFRQACALDPDHVGYKCSLSRSLWSNGKFEESWQYADCCFECGLRTPNRKFEIPRWQGEPLADRSVLVWREQGVGDELRIARRYPEIIAAAGQCIIEADPRLIPIFERSFPDAEFRPVDIDAEHDLRRRDADFQLPANNLFQFFPLSEDELARERDYNGYLLRDRLAIQRQAAAYQGHLKPDAALAALWRERIEALGPGLKIGICWRSQLNDRLRDLHYSQLDDWAGFLRMPGLQFVNLQYDDCAAEIEAVEARTGVTLHRWSDIDLKQDLDSAMALTAQLDLVITAPTSVAEIAAAVGVETWCIITGALEINANALGKVDAASTFYWPRHWGETWEHHIDRLGTVLRDRL